MSEAQEYLVNISLSRELLRCNGKYDRVGVEYLEALKMSEIKNEVATLDLMDSKHEFPIMEGSVGPSVVNISIVARSYRPVYVRSGLHFYR